MDKIKRGLLVSCFFAFLCPFTVTAMPFTEMTAEVTGFDNTSSAPDVIISVAFLDGQDLDVVVNASTEVDDSILNDSLIGTAVKIEAFDTVDGLIALEILPDDSLNPVYELKGIITGIDTGKREITLFGSHISVPEDAEIKNGEGVSIELDELIVGPVMVEGVVNILNEGTEFEGTEFEVTEIKEIAKLECQNNATHIFKAHKPADLTHKTTEHYCESDKGKIVGRTLISFTDYTGEDVSSYTVGKYLDGDRHGYWLSIDVTGNVIRQCRYNQGSLVDGDESCPG
jgi:hypothetical protein